MINYLLKDRKEIVKKNKIKQNMWYNQNQSKFLMEKVLE